MKLLKGSNINPKNIKRRGVEVNTAETVLINPPGKILVDTFVEVTDDKFQISADTALVNESILKFYEIDSTNYVGFQAPSSIGADLAWTLPPVDGSSGQALITDGSGVLSWVDVNTGGGSTGVTDDNSSNLDMYPVFVPVTDTGADLRTASSKLTFNPSTGQLNATEINTTSDISAKTDINPILDALDIIDKLEGFRFNWKDTNQPSIGVMAQNTQKVLPELVKTNAENKLTVNYSGIIPVLIEAVKELKKIVDRTSI